MRVLIISHNIVHVREYYQGVIQELSQQHEVIIAAPQLDNTLHALSNVTLITWDLPVRRWQMRSRYQAWRRMARIIHLHHPDLIWSVGFPVSYGLRRLCARKCYWRWIASFATTVSARQLRRVARRADEMIVHHTEITSVQTTARLIPAPTVLCPAQPKVLPKKPIILFYGCLSSYNVLERFLDAAKVLRPYYPDAQFWVAGKVDNRQQEAVHFALQEAQAAQEITFIEQVDDMQRLIQQVSLVIIPAQMCNTVPYVMIWALAQGRPVISMNVPGIRCVFEHNKQGWIVAFADKSGIAWRISHALAYPERLKAMSQAAHQFAKQRYHQTTANKALLQAIIGA